MTQYATFNNSSAFVRARLQVALYQARKKRIARLSESVEEDDGESEGEGAPANALSFNDQPLTYNGQYLTLGS